MDDPGGGRRVESRAASTILESSAHKHRNLRSFSDWYVTILASVLTVVALISFIAFRPPSPGCLTSQCPAALESSSLAALLLATALVHLVAALLGPVSVNAAEAFWIFSSPLDRRSLLAPRKLTLLISGSVIGSMVGLAHFVLWNGNPWWLLAFPTGALLAVSLAMRQQGWRTPGRRSTLSLLVVGALITAIVAVSPAATIVVSSFAVPGLASAIGALSLLLLSRRAWMTSNQLPLAELRRVHGGRDAIAGAISSADSGLFLDVIWARLLASRSVVAVFRLRTTSWRAVLESEARRCVRSPLLLTCTLLFAVVMALAHLAGAQAGLVGISLGTMIFASPSASSLRLYATSPGVGRAFPQRAATMRLLFVTPSTVLVILIVIASSIAATLAPMAGSPSGLAVGAATVAGLAGGIRWSTAPPTQFSTGILMTEMGPIHVSAWLNATRGIDVVLLLVVPLLLGLSPLLSLVIALLAWSWTLLRE